MVNKIKSPDIYGIVLAGGKSRRFGRDKGLVPYKGKPLAAHSLDILQPHCHQLGISTNNPEAYTQFGTRVFSDLLPGKGPLGGMYTAMKELPGKVFVFLGCDLPEVPIQLIGFLLSKLENRQAVIPVHKGFRETMCGVYRKECLPMIEKAMQQNRLRILDALNYLDTGYEDIDREPFYRPGIFHNVNYPEDILPGK